MNLLNNKSFYFAPKFSFSLLLLLTLNLQSCSQNKSDFSKKFQSIDAVVEPPLVITNPENETLCLDGISSGIIICDPLMNVRVPGVGSSNRQGLKATIFEGNVDWKNIAKYISQGEKHETILHFSNLNIPWSIPEGFKFSSGEVLRSKRDQEPLLTWFVLDIKGKISLPADKEPGWYHIATISDDSVWVNVGGVSLIQKDLIQPTQVTCASKNVYLNHGVFQDFNLKYFQGPQAITLMAYLIRVDNESSPAPENAGCDSYAITNGANSLLDANYEIINTDFFSLP